VKTIGIFLALTLLVIPSTVHAQTGQINLDDYEIYAIIAFVIIGIIVISSIIKSSQRKPEPMPYKKRPRYKFPPNVEEKTIKNQGYRCNDPECRKKLGRVKGRNILYEFDHIDGNKLNTDPSNCQALCLNCHGIKTERERNMHRD